MVMINALSTEPLQLRRDYFRRLIGLCQETWVKDQCEFRTFGVMFILVVYINTNVPISYRVEDICDVYIRDLEK